MVTGNDSGLELALGPLSRCFDRSPEPIGIVSGPTHVLRYANPALGLLLGQRVDQLLGSQIGSFLPDANECTGLLDRVRRIGGSATCAQRRSADPRAIFWSITIWPAGPNDADGIAVHIATGARFLEQTVEMNEALLLGSLRQHELRAVSESANARLLIENRVRKQAEAASLENEQRLRATHRQLGEKADLLEILVQERTVKLRETVSELEAFSYSIAHDLRAPLRSMSAFADILLREHTQQLDEEGQHFLRRIAKSAVLMDQLIRDVLNYGQVLQANLSLENVDVQALVADLQESSPRFASANANIAVTGPLPTVLGNAAMLMQVFSHLLSNAVTFVKPGCTPRVEIWSETKDSRARFFVRDHGIGIPSDQFERIFGIFERLDTAHDGTGIGLAIAKKAMERMSGSVGVVSELGQGSTFWFELQQA